MPRLAASADQLLQSLLAVFTEKQLQRALAIVDQVRALTQLECTGHDRSRFVRPVRASGLTLVAFADSSARRVVRRGAWEQAHAVPGV